MAGTKYETFTSILFQYPFENHTSSLGSELDSIKKVLRSVF